MDSENIALGELVSELSERILNDYSSSTSFSYWAKCSWRNDRSKNDRSTRIVDAIKAYEKPVYLEFSHGVQLRMQVKEVKQFYASLIMLRSRCIEVDDEYSPLPGSTAEEENPTSDGGYRMRVLLRHDQYQALNEILTELPDTMKRHRERFLIKTDKSIALQQTYAARKCNSTTTWTDGGMIPYYWLLSNNQVEDLESFLLGAEALLRLLCETVANFNVLWLNCLNALSTFCSMPEVETQLESSLLRAWMKAPVCWNLYFGRYPVCSFGLFETRDRLVTRLKCTTQLISLHFARSLSEVGRQSHKYLRGRVKAGQQNLTKIGPSRKELPMIIGGKEIKAQHDSGAERGNFMDCNLASKLNLRVRTEKGDCKRFSMGNGKVVKALGRVRAVCAFAKEAQTKMKCWFYVFDELASPLIMGSQFLEKTKTLSDYVHRLEDCIPKPSIVPMVNLIGSTQQAKRRFTAYIDHRHTLINADSGSDLDLMSSTYIRAHRYRLDRRQRCRKRVRFADNTMAETIGQVQATLTLEDGSMYSKTFDVLPELTSDVLLGQFTLEEIKAFQIHRSSFVDVFAGERHLELSVLGYLGKVNEFLACKLRRVHRRRSPRQNQVSLAKQQDDDLMEALQAQDLEAERLHLQHERSAAVTTTPEGGDGDEAASETAQEDHAGPPPITLARDLEGPSIQEAVPVGDPPPCLT